MDLQHLASSIGIVDPYPQDMEGIYTRLKDTQAPACDLKAIDDLQREYHLFGEHYEQVRRIAEEVNGDPLRNLWVRVASAYAMEYTKLEARQVPVPQADGTEITDFLPLYILIALIPGSIANYRRRGFTEAELAEILPAYKAGIDCVVTRTGRPGINQTYYGWLMHFAKAEIFKTHGLQFEIRKLPAEAIWLKHKETGTILPVMLNTVVCGGGKYQLGSAGHEDDADAFAVTFEEDAENYYGHGCYDCVVSQNRETFPKSQWDCLIKPGDFCLGMHIPQGANIAPEHIQKACEDAKRIAVQYYPECNGSEIYCASWLLDPILEELSGEHSKLTAFMKCFSKHPHKNDGKSVFGFIFPRYCEDYRELPEDTSLQRKVKKLYIDGGYIYFTSGIYCR